MGINTLTDKKAMQLLLNTLANDPDEYVRSITLLGLWRYPNEPEVVEGLIRALQDESEEVRFEVVCALEDIGDEKALPYLRYIAENDEGGAQGGYEPIKPVAEDVIKKILARIDSNNAK